MLIFGTRPEAIKMCPLVLELKRRSGIKVTVCVTGQHKELLSGVLDVFGVVPDYDLAIMKEKQTLSALRLTVRETWGGGAARVNEIRVYEERKD